MYLKVRFKDGKRAEYIVQRFVGWKHLIAFYKDSYSHYTYTITYEPSKIILRTFENEFTDHFDKEIEEWRVE